MREFDTGLNKMQLIRMQIFKQFFEAEWVGSYLNDQSGLAYKQITTIS